MQNVAEVHQHIEKQAKENAVQEVRNIDKIEIGRVVRQGDIYIHRVKKTHACGKATKNRQLAIGSTNGSRHVAESPCEVFEGTTRPEWCQQVFLGPVVKSKKAFKISHPEHAHIVLPAGVYQITHQMDARTLQRVRD